MPDDFGQDFLPTKPTVEQQLAAILDEVRHLRGAFPRTDDGECDLDGHRRYHEAMIEAAKEQAQFWRELRTDLAKKGAWGLILLLLGLMFTGIAAKMGFLTASAAAAASTTIKP